MIDVRNPGDGFAALRSRIAALGSLPDGDRGTPGAPLTVGEWALLIDDIVDHPQDNTEGLWNVAGPDEDDREYDAIFVGGGAAGRFGSAFLRARGGRQLTIDAWPFLGGSCPHQACVPHHLFSEAAHQLDLARHMQGRLWYPPFDEKRASILEIVQLFKAGRMYPHAIMNWQSKEQLNMEFILNTPARIIDEHTVEVEGRRFQARNLVLCTGVADRVPGRAGHRASRGSTTSPALIEDLDYEPNRCVIIGGSKVALEYGSFFQATGCQTTILTRSPLMETASLHHVDAGLREYVVADDGRPRHRDRRGRGTARGARQRQGHRGALPACPAARSGRSTPTSCSSAPGSAPTSACTRRSGWPPTSAGSSSRTPTCAPRCRACTRPATWSARRWRCSRRASAGSARPATSWARTTSSTSREYPDFLHTTYEVTWCGLSEAEARAAGTGTSSRSRCRRTTRTRRRSRCPAAEGSMLYAFTRPILSGWLKLVIDADSRKVLGAHHVGYGAKDAFQYIDYLIRRPEGFTMDEMAELNELFLNPEHFIQLCRLRAGQAAR